MSNEKPPALFLYVKDYLNAPDLRRCSWAARGVWMDAICISWLESPQGVIRAESRAELCRILGDSETVLNPLIDELIAKGVADSDGPGVLICRRITRMAKLKQTRSKAGSKGAEKRWGENSNASPASAVCDGKAHSKADGKKMANHGSPDPIPDPSPLKGRVVRTDHARAESSSLPADFDATVYEIAPERYENLCGDYGPRPVNYYIERLRKYCRENGKIPDDFPAYVENIIKQDRDSKSGFYSDKPAAAENGGPARPKLFVPEVVTNLATPESIDDTTRAAFEKLTGKKFGEPAGAADSEPIHAGDESGSPTAET